MSFFYFYIFTLLGFAGGAASLVAVWVRNPFNIASLPLWAHRLGKLYATIGAIADILALSIIFYRYGIYYLGISILEICFGAFLLGFTSKTFKLYIALISPYIIFWCIAPLIGLWYLSETMMWLSLVAIIGLYIYIVRSNKDEYSIVVPPQNLSVTRTESSCGLDGAALSSFTPQRSEFTSSEITQRKPEYKNTKYKENTSNKFSTILVLILIGASFFIFIYFSKPADVINKQLTDSTSNQGSQKIEFNNKLNEKNKIPSNIESNIVIDPPNRPTYSNDVNASDVGVKKIYLGEERIVTESFIASGLSIPTATKIIITAVEDNLIDYMFELNGQIYSERVDYSVILHNTQ